MSLENTYSDPAAKRGMSPKDWITVILGGLYVVSPVDFIPDTIPVAGWFDDFLVGITSISTVLNAQLSESNMLLSGILKTVKYISFLLFAIIALLILVFGAIIYQIFVN